MDICNIATTFGNLHYEINYWANGSNAMQIRTVSTQHRHWSIIGSIHPLWTKVRFYRSLKLTMFTTKFKQATSGASAAEVMTSMNVIWMPNRSPYLRPCSDDLIEIQRFQQTCTLLYLSNYEDRRECGNNPNTSNIRLDKVFIKEEENVVYVTFNL